MLNMFSQCPGCGGALVITECKCTGCKLQMRGEFLPGPFSKLSDEQLAFIRVFLRVRGNLTEVEKTLGVSYPTIRNKLDEVNSVLEGIENTSSLPERKDTADSPQSVEEIRKQILRKVADGQLSTTEAIQHLKELKGTK